MTSKKNFNSELQKSKYPRIAGSALAICSAILLGSWISLNFMESAIIVMAVSAAFTFVILQKKNTSHSILNLVCFLPIVSVLIYFPVRNSLLAEVGLVALTLSGMNIMLGLNLWMQRPQGDGFHLNTISVFAITVAIQLSLNLAISEENISASTLQGILALSLIGLACSYGASLTRKMRRGIRRKDQFFLLAIPTGLISILAIYNPNIIMTATLGLITTLACLSYWELSKPLEVVKLSRPIQKKTVSTAHYKKFMEQFGFQLRTSLHNIVNTSENLLESNLTNQQEIKGIISESKIALEHWMSVVAINNTLIQKQAPTLFDAKSLIASLKNLERNRPERFQAFIPESFPPINSNMYALSFLIYSLTNRDEFSHLDVKIHFYNTISRGSRYVNIDIRGFNDEIEILDQPNEGIRNQKDYQFQIDICENLKGSFIDKSLRSSTPFYTICLILEESQPEDLFRSAKTGENQEQSAQVLIVDDDPDIVDLLSEFMTSHGIASIKASAGQEALEKFKSQNPCCVITDMLMPEFDGMELIKSIRAYSNQPTIIGISGSKNENLAAEAKHFGADHFYEKPPNLQTIVEQVQQAAIKTKKVA